MNHGCLLLYVLCGLACYFEGLASATGQETRLALTPQMLSRESSWDDPAGLIDEQQQVGDPPATEAKSAWATDWRHAKEFPVSVHFDLGEEKPLSALWVYDINDMGVLEISAGQPGNWRKVADYKTEAYNKWVRIELAASTRYLRLTRMSPSCQIAEIAIYTFTPEAWRNFQQQKLAQAQAAAEKAAALARAEQEAKQRPLLDMGPLFGNLPLVDEIDCAQQSPDHLFSEFPVNASKVEALIGQAYRTVLPRKGEASFLSWRIGRYKMLKPGATYLLVIDYPEDAPRSMIVLNGGCETVRGFHTGTTVGDALRAKYVWSNPESLQVPLSGRHETWKQFFYLHDRFPERAFIRGAGIRALTPDDGFPVTIAQFSQENDPPSRGIAVRRIRLFEVPDPKRLAAPVRMPAGVPTRHIFWREEMADGVIDSAKGEERGLANPLDWYRYKAGLMKFLGVNTFSKDLLEFGACQHWDSTAGGGNNWVFFSDRHKGLWEQVIKLMGKENFSVLPYYEYAGSRGYKGLGNQRRARPLTRDDAFTHISWIEAANADITDPDTWADFQKMLDLTVVRFKADAQFLGAWLRPRSQLPMGFGDATRARFAKEANGAVSITRQQLVADKALKEKYYNWWFEKRRAFLQAMRDHLRTNGVNSDATILFTADASEPGVSFRSWDPKLVTDNKESALEWLKIANEGQNRKVTPIGLDEVLKTDLYLQALLSPPMDWGGWEPSHASPAADPQHYSALPGALMTHGYNRSYTVASPKSLDLFRGPSGLAVVRHFSLNENMLFDQAGKDLLGYVVADMERAGTLLHARRSPGSC